MFQPVRQVSVNFADNEKQSNKTFNILYFMKTNLVNLALGLAFTGGAVSCQSQKNDLVFEHQGDTVTIVHIARPAKYFVASDSGEQQGRTGKAGYWEPRRYRYGCASGYRQR